MFFNYTRVAVTPVGGLQVGLAVVVTLIKEQFVLEKDPAAISIRIL
jgi:hypothetical protein